MKNILLPVLMLLLFSACKKNSSTPNMQNTISAVIGDNQQSFNSALQAKSTSTPGGGSQFVLTGANGTGATANVLTVTITSPSQITPGTYATQENGTNKQGAAVMLQQKGLALVYKSDVFATQTFSVTISSISSTNIQGSFVGSLVLSEGYGPGGITVTRGTFNVDF